MTWVFKIIRYLFITIDWIAYSLIRVFYNLFASISSVGVYQKGLLANIYDRIYAIIGVYAIFKVVFVLINMMINPDEQSKGGNNPGKVATRIVVMLAVIILVPDIFSRAYELQNTIVKENVIGKIIMGENQSGVNFSDSGQNIANQIFSGFVSKNENVISNGSCNDAFMAIDLLNNELSSTNPSNQGISGIMANIGTEVNGEFCIEYNFIISTIAGGFAAYIILVYCLDIGLRAVKLIFYQLIAPIPVASYVDGKKNGPFQKWIKSVGTEYADLFLRLVIIYTIIMLIDNYNEIFDFTLLNNTDIVTALFTKIIIILGMLMFAKQAPKLIMDVLGVEGGGDRFGLNAKEKITQSPLAAAAVGAAGGLAMSGIANAAAIPSRVATATKATKDAGGGKRAQILSGIKAGVGSTVGIGTGAMSGAFRAGKASMQGGKNVKFGQILTSTRQATNDARNARDKARADFNDRAGLNYTSNMAAQSSFVGKAGAFFTTAKNRAGARIGDLKRDAGSSYRRFSGVDVKENKAISGNIQAWQDEIATLDRIISADVSNGKYGASDIKAGGLREASYNAGDGTTQKYKYREYANSEYENIQKRKAELSAMIKYEQERLDKGKPKKEN